MSRKGLLNDVAAELGCICLSDLRSDQLRESTMKEIEKIDPDEYDLLEWNDAVDYLTGNTMAFKSASEAKNCIVDRMLKGD